MRVCRLITKNYRNLIEGMISFDEKINIICGENAQGKTNIIEALWLLTGTRSFRGAKDRNLITFGQNSAGVSGEIDFLDRKSQIEIHLNQGKRTAIVNDIKRGPAPTIIGLFKAVIFSPEHLSLIKGGPENRRKLIDAAICQLKPTYPALLVRYNKALRHRNVLLKDTVNHSEIDNLLDAWDRKVAEYSGAIIFERLKYIKKLSLSAKILYEELSKGETFDISYSNQEFWEGASPKKISEDILKKMEEARKTDILRGLTSVGAHRDELKIKIDGKPARLFASQGQQRSGVIAMKLAEAGIIGEVTGEMPVVLLDDILSELDENRQSYMFKNVTKAQIIMTGCMAPKIKENYKILQIKDGKISV